MMRVLLLVLLMASASGLHAESYARRDDVRAFLCGQPGTVPALATRIAGSSDLYQVGCTVRRPSERPSVLSIAC